MSYLNESLSQFADTVIPPTMVHHSTLKPLLEGQELEHHGILQALRDAEVMGIPLDDPIMTMLLPHSDLVNFAFWSEEDSFLASAAALLRGRQSYDKIVRDGFWSRAWTWLNDFDVESEQKSTPGRRLAIAEIHAPHVNGCIGTFAVGSQGALDVSIKAFGLGYQRVKRLTVGNSYEEPHGCASLTVGVEFLVYIWKHRFSDKRRALIKMIGIDETMSGARLDESVPHRCSATYREVAPRLGSIAQNRGLKLGADYSDVPMREADRGASTTQNLILEEGCLYSATLELLPSWFSKVGEKATKLATISKLAISIESRVARTVEISWKLVGGHNYMRFRGVRGDMRMFWVWE